LRGIPLKTSFPALALLVVCSAGIANADERAEALQHYDKGRKAFDLGAYDEAATEYASAYRIKDDPALLYNLGQANRLANHPAEALRSYRMFLIRVPDASNREEVEQKIAELQKVIAQQKKAQSIPPDSPKTPAVLPSAPSPAPSSSSVVDQAHSARVKTIAGGALLGVGAAIVVGGVVCGVLAKQSSDNLSKLDQMMQAFNSGQERAGKTEQTLEGVLIGVGAAALLTGGVLMLVGHREQRARRLSMVPSVGSSHVGVLAGVSF
jgi:tetratricopeptide (TPR) repeat protein